MGVPPNVLRTEFSYGRFPCPKDTPPKARSEGIHSVANSAGLHMTDFTFDFTLLEHGWAKAQVASPETVQPLSASYLSDALGDLTRSVIRLFSATELETITCSWQEEPGEFRWIIRRCGDSIRLQIRMFHDTASRKRDEEGSLLFETQCSLLRLATQVQSQLYHVLTKFGEEGYLLRWMNYPFPMSEYQQLTTLIQRYTANGKCRDKI